MNRKLNRVSWILTVAGVTLAGTVAFALYGRAGADRSSFLDVSRSGKNVSLVWVGDTMLGADAQGHLDTDGYLWPFDQVAPLLDADVTIVNYEATMTTRNAIFDTAQKWSYLTRPDVAKALSQVGVDILNLANNHAMDAGPGGLSDTVRHARSAGLRTFGAGADLLEASRPLLIRTQAGTMALVGFAEYYGDGDSAGTEKPGTLTLSRRTIRDAFSRAERAGADWVVAGVHWGENYASVEQLQRQWAQEFADAGYSMVIGSGPHVSQPIEFLGSMPVFYSLGNFIFTTRGRYSEFQTPGLGLLLRLELSVDRPPLVRLHCVVTDNREVAFQTRPCDTPRATALLHSLSPHISMEGDVGVLPCDRCLPPASAGRGATAWCDREPCAPAHPRPPRSESPPTVPAAAPPSATLATPPSPSPPHVEPTPRASRRRPQPGRHRAIERTTPAAPVTVPAAPQPAEPVASSPRPSPRPPTPSAGSPKAPEPVRSHLAVAVTCTGIRSEMERGDRFTVTYHIESTTTRRIAVHTALLDERGRDRAEDAGGLELLTLHPGRTTVTFPVELPDLRRDHTYEVVGQLWPEGRVGSNPRALLAHAACGRIEIDD